MQNVFDRSDDPGDKQVTCWNKEQLEMRMCVDLHDNRCVPMPDHKLILSRFLVSSDKKRDQIKLTQSGQNAEQGRF